MATTDSGHDGRVERSARSRASIVDALMALVSEGNLRPTAQQVASRAGVGDRTVFRHFRAMDTLYAEMDSRLREEFEPYFDVSPPGGGLDVRAHGLADQRIGVFERLAPFIRATAPLRFESDFVGRRTTSHRRALRAQLMDWLPELEGCEPALTEAIEATLSFETWNRLRQDQRLGLKRARAALDVMLFALVDKIGSSRR